MCASASLNENMGAPQGTNFFPSFASLGNALLALCRARMQQWDSSFEVLAKRNVLNHVFRW